MPSLPVWAAWRDGSLRLQLHVQPGARRSAVAGVHGERLKVVLQAAPVEGRANEELRRFLARALGMRLAQVEILAGQSSRSKTVAMACAQGEAAGLAASLAGAV